MSQLEIKALEANFEAWKAERVPTLTRGEAFEIYSIEQVLKDEDLSDEDIQSGNFGSGDDGGVDAMYFFVNRALMRDGIDIPNPALEADLVVIQAKEHNGFSEVSIQKLEDFTSDLLDFTKPVATLTYLNSKARDSIELFRENYSAILKDAPALRIRFFYLTKSIDAPNLKVIKRVENLGVAVHKKISNAEFSFDYWGCAELLAARRKTPLEVEVVPIVTQFGTADGSVVCLVLLKDFAAFLTDDKDGIKTRILEANVRDYQGKNKPVNEAIKETLERGDHNENFWWLNNGITILAEECAMIAQKISIKRPEIVNGLQTSYEIYHARNILKTDSKRAVLLRIITAKDEKSRNRIIKATNSQTQINPLTLRATEKIHFDIEDTLLLYNLLYDRKKGKYKHQRKPMASIVSMREMSQAVMTVLLQRPNDARARPQTVTNNAADYDAIFNPKYTMDLFASCILLDRHVDEYVQKTALLYDEKRNIRYYLLMVVACELTKKSTPTVDEIAAILLQCVADVDPKVLAAAEDEVLKLFRELGGDDAGAKGNEMSTRLKALLALKFP